VRNRLCGICLVVGFAQIASVAQADSIFDEFSDGTIDPANWTVFEPFPGSDAVESGGQLHLIARPYVATAAQWTPSAAVRIFIEFDWRVGSSLSQIKVVTRSDATWFGAFAEVRSGVVVNLLADQGIAWISAFDDALGVGSSGSGVDGAEYPGVPLSFPAGTSHHIRIEDDGAVVRLFVNDLSAPILEGNIARAYSTNRVVFYNRELGGEDTIDNVRIGQIAATPIPEPGTLALGLCALAATVSRRRRPPAR